MTRLRIKQLISGGVITNYNCVSRCGHCLYNSSPSREKDYLDAATAADIFKRITALGCRAVHIGGGEPLLHPRKLAAVLAAAREVGMGIDYVETNCAWFIDAGQSEAILETLSASGMQTLLVSISPFHNAFIPFSRVQGVIGACRRCGIHVLPWVNAFVRDLTRMDQHRTHTMEEFKSLLGEDYLKRIPERYWIHLGGRALETFRSVYPLKTAARILETSPLSCARALSDTSHFHIDFYGNYIPGLCAGLAIDMEDLGRALPEGKYPLLEQLAAGGIRGLHRWATESFGYMPRRNGFLNHCDLCTDIRRYLRERNGQHFTELAPEGFYTEATG